MPGHTSRRSPIVAVGVLLSVLLGTVWEPQNVAAAVADSVVVRWNAAALQGVRDSHLGPPMAARALAIVHTCMYDAWAAYDRVAVGIRYGAALRRPPGERTR